MYESFSFLHRQNELTIEPDELDVSVGAVLQVFHELELVLES